VDHCYPASWRNATATAGTGPRRLTLPSGGTRMPPSQVPVQDIESVRAALVLVIAGVMIFWKLVLRVALAIIVVAAGLGLFVLAQSAHR